MDVTVSQVTGTAVSTLTVGFVIWLVTVPARQRSVTGLIASVVVTGPFAVLGGIGWALLLGPRVRGQEAALLLATVAVVVAALESGVFAARAYRRFCRAQRALRASLDTVAGANGRARTGPRLAELEAVRRDLERVAEHLRLEREEEHARDTSFRRLVGWVSADLRAPLAALQAIRDNAATGPSADVRREIDRLTGVVSDLADLTSTVAPSERANDDQGPTLVRDLVADVTRRLGPVLRVREVSVAVCGDDESRVSAGGAAGEDPREVLLAALADAVHRAASGEVVRVEASCCADDDVVRLSIVGTGGSDPAQVRLPLALGTLGSPRG